MCYDSNVEIAEPIDPKLGVGVYTLQEAALYSHVSTKLLSRWFLPSKNFERALTPSFPSEERVISFLDFVQALAVRTIRMQHKVTLAKIREGIARAENQYQKSYPLARRRTIYLFGDDLYILPQDNDEAEYEKLTGLNRNQKTIKKVVELYMNDIGFDLTTGLADLYSVHKYYSPSAEARSITMNPKLRFGEPMVDRCHYSAKSLWEACQAEGGIAEAAHAYGVEQVDVDAAYRYYDSLLVASGA